MSEPLSGKRGAVKVDGAAIAEITRWNLRTASALDSWGSSSTGGEEDNVGGTVSREGSFDFKIDKSAFQHGTIEEGESYTLQLILDTDDDTKYEGPARIGEVTCETVVDQGPAIVGTATFRGRPGWTKPS